jgi:AAA family ATP:ADP antiporter
LVARLRRLYEIRPGEGLRATLMFWNVALIIAAYTTTKAVRDAVFLAHFDLIQLSYLMIVVAVVAGVVVSVFTRATAHLPRDKAILGTHGFIAITMVILAVGLRGGGGAWAWALYFWSSLFGLLLVAEFWLLANDLFDAREAKRLFPFIGAGAILGGVVGGAIPGWLSRLIGANNLLYVVAVELLLAALLAHYAYRARTSEIVVKVEPTTSSHFAEGLRLLFERPYVRLIAGIVTCMTVCATLVQWQVKGIAKTHFGGRQDDMATFFGRLSMALNIASFALQVLGTPRLLRRFGISFGLRVLPAGFVIGALCLLGSTILPIALPAAAAAMLLSDGFRYSVDKASLELLYVPLPRTVKSHVKPFIDTVIDRGAGAFAGFLWIALDWMVHIGRPDRLPYASLLTLVVVVCWLLLVARAQSGYVNAYRSMLGMPVNVSPTVGELTTAAPALRHEASQIRLLLRLLVLERRESQRAGRASVLEVVLESRLDAALGRIERLLGAAYPLEALHQAVEALRATSPIERAGALELLDNQLTGEGKRELIEALEELVIGPSNEQSLSLDLSALARENPEVLPDVRAIDEEIGVRLERLLRTDPTVQPN